MTDEFGTLLTTDSVKPEWIDRNHHMNVAYYVLAFDLAIDVLWDGLGMPESYIDERGFSTFAVESHVAWLKEMPEAAAYRIRSQILAYDDKRIHHFQWMYHAEQGYLAATAEWMNLHVDIEQRRVCPWPPDVRQRLAARFAEQAGNDRSGHRDVSMLIREPLECVVNYPDRRPG